MGLLTYIASPKKLREQARLEFYIQNITREEPGLVTDKCFKNKYVYSFTSVLNSGSTPYNFCPYDAFQHRDIDDYGNIISKATKERAFIEWKYLVKLSLDSRGALVSYIKQHLHEGDFFEMYSLLCGMVKPDVLPEPEYITTLSVDEVQKFE